MNWMRLSATFLLLHIGAEAQEPVTVATDPPTVPGTEVEPAPPVDSGANNASIFNEGEARTMTLAVPAPRGLILDREGRPLAQTKMGYHLALDFTQFSELNAPEKAVAWAQNLVTQSNSLTGDEQTYSDEKLLEYYEHRRWIPRSISQTFDEKKAKSLEPTLPAGLTILPVYLRHYPEKSIAAHLIGYVGAQTVLPSGPIYDGDPLFQSVMGKSGFEMVFDAKLRGTPGSKKMIFDTQGRKVLDEIIERPRPGGNIVTTIDLDWQRYAERVLREGSKRGAFVVIDIQTGEVLVMASRPTYDLNEFVPYITTERYAELNDDPSAPLFGRAFMAEYPPASTFKPVVSLAAITNGAISYNQTINCPYEIKIGNKMFRNHSKGHQGRINAQRALAKSVNPWFYQVGIKTGPQAFLSVARRLGYGTKTGLPLVGEQGGSMPTAEYIEKRMGRPTTDGDTANLSIGQGLATATPLQVAQSMAAIGNGSALMELQLVRQIQDFHGRVIEAPVFKKKNDLDISPKALEVTRQGMRDVVHAGYGTGKGADLGFTVMCGKTGTAQWKPEKNQNLAWFSGFFPYDNPRYAFAVVYEGVPNESVSGGRNAAPMVRRFFRNFRTEIQENLKPAAKAMIVSEDEGEIDFDTIPKAMTVDDDEIPVAIPVEEDPEDIPVAVPVAGEPGEIPAIAPVEPETPTTDIPTVPDALPVSPPAPADSPRPEPEVPADR
ncbi:penicillin-binding transpeptidase domain-containing protein [Verrucomicrobiaceae bacterium 227]